MLNYCGYFLGNFWEKLVNFLIQHLITLVCSFPECVVWNAFKFEARQIGLKH